MKIFSTLFLILCSILFSCNSKAVSSQEQQGDYVEHAEDVAGQPYSMNDPINEFGLLKEIEDSGYPFVSLTIEFTERKFSESFSMNLEDLKIDPKTLNSWKGKYVKFSYTSNISNSLLDINFNGEWLMESKGPEANQENKTIKGTLEGAEEETQGDLPGMVTISNSKESQKFEFFITKEMVNANGKTVEAVYSERVSNEIKSIEVSTN
jgi:hypothetical protein